MENEDQHIPEHLSERWDAVSQALAAAAIRLSEASQAYNEVITERLELSRELKNWQMKTYFGIDDYIKSPAGTSPERGAASPV